MRHRDYSNPLPFRDELLQVFIPRMYYNYLIERRPSDEPAAMLFTSATRKSVIPPPPVRLSWDSRHPPPESVRTDGRTYADVRTKIFRINGLPNFLTHGAPRAPLSRNDKILRRFPLNVRAVSAKIKLPKKYLQHCHILRTDKKNLSLLLLPS